MPFLMNISFDNTVRLQRRTYLFEYKTLRFKLVQNDPRRFPDHLLTVISSYNSPERGRAFAAAAEFASALAWQNDAQMTIWDSGGAGYSDNRTLRSAQPTNYSLPRLPFRGRTTGGNLVSIPHIQSEEQRVALALFREARASNNLYLSLLFFWQALEVKGQEPGEVANRLVRKHRHQVRLESSWFDRLPLAGRSIGKYLEEDCRHAIAHIRRKPGKRKLDLDSWDEQLRFAVSARVAEALAEAFIRYHIGMTRTLTLVRPRSGGFPCFLEESAKTRGRFVVAYPPKAWNLGAFKPPRFLKAPSRRYE